MFCSCLCKTRVCSLEWNLSTNQFIDQSVEGLHVTCVTCSLIFCTDTAGFLLWNQETIPPLYNVITLYQSCTCLTAIYILVFLTSPTFFFSIYHPCSYSHTLASPIFPLPSSNCHANRHRTFYASTFHLESLLFMLYNSFVNFYTHML